MVHTNNVVTDVYIQIKEIDVRFYKEASTSDPVLYLLDIVWTDTIIQISYYYLFHVHRWSFTCTLGGTTIILSSPNRNTE